MSPCSMIMSCRPISAVSGCRGVQADRLPMGMVQPGRWHDILHSWVMPTAAASQVFRAPFSCRESWMPSRRQDPLQLHMSVPQNPDPFGL